VAIFFDTDKVSVESFANDRACSNARERVKHQITFRRTGFDYPLNQPFRFLYRVEGLPADKFFGLVRKLLYVSPHIARILAISVELRLPIFPVRNGRHSLATKTVLQFNKLRHTNSIQVEGLGSISLYKVTDDVVVVCVVEPALGKATGLIPDDL
jgi:hypothetical protein